MHIIYDIKNKIYHFWIGWFRILTAQVDSWTCQLRKMISETFGRVGDSSAEKLVWHLTASSKLLYDYYT